MTLPAITPLPPAPARSDAPNDFSAKADAFAAALPGLVNELNEAADFIDQRAADAQQSAQAALNAVAVAGSAEGLPALAGNAGKVLRINAQENAVFWDTAAPPASSGTPGLVALATPAEAVAGTDPAKAIVSAVLAAVLAGYARLDSPTFSGAPKVPTPAAGDDSLRAANTAFVQATLRAAIAAMVNQSPAALDTLNELAAALGNDPNFATTVLNALAGKQPLLGFTPIQQGGGANQGTNKLYIGWGSDTTLKLQVDSTDFGSSWPINVTGRATGNYQMVAAQSFSGTALDITGIPSWAKEITLCFSGLSTNGAASNPMIQLISMAGVVSAGYNGNVTSNNNGQVACAVMSAYMLMEIASWSAGGRLSGVVTLRSMGGNMWSVQFENAREDTTYATRGVATVPLEAALSGIRFSTVSGTDSFDAGVVSMTYKG